MTKKKSRPSRPAPDAPPPNSAMPSDEVVTLKVQLAAAQEQAVKDGITITQLLSSDAQKEIAELKTTIEGLSAEIGELHRQARETPAPAAPQVIFHPQSVDDIPSLDRLKPHPSMEDLLQDTRGALVAKETPA